MFKLWLRAGCLFFLFVLAAGIYLLTPFPLTDEPGADYPETFVITSENSLEAQPPGQCSAYSVAYVLRHFGQNALGEEIYQELKYKIPVSGYVLPKGVLRFVNSKGYAATLYKGNSIASLKSTLFLQGNPIIVIIGDGFRWQHYMTLVGYDERTEDFYFYDSKEITDSNEGLPGNRTIKEEYFLKLWNNGLPVFNRVYFTFE